jgi:hypothetical protein
VTDRSPYYELLLQGAVGVLAQDRHLRAVHLLACLARGTVPARDDRVQHHLVAGFDIRDALTDRVDDAGAIGAEDGRQWTLGQSTGDKHVKVVERHISQSNADLAIAGLDLGSFTYLQRRGTVEANQFQCAHTRIMKLWA